MSWDTWWFWVAGGLLLAILELVAPGAIFIGFAAGAILIGGLLAAGVTMTLPWAVLGFALASLCAWIVLRQALGVRKNQTRKFDRDINED